MKNQIAIGLSLSSYEILKFLKNRGYANEIFMSKKAFLNLRESLDDLKPCLLAEILEKYWSKDTFFILIGSLGAAVRLIVPLMRSKRLDPGIVVVDSKGLKVISLIGGHQVGADQFAIQLSQDLGAIPILTGDSNSQKRLPLDSFGESWGWVRSGSEDSWKDLMVRQAHGNKINVLQNVGTQIWSLSQSADNIFMQEVNSKSNSKDFSFDLFIGSSKIDKCSWHPLVIWIGIGCEKGTSLSLLERAIYNSLKKGEIAQEAIAGIASIDVKRKEEALMTLSKKKDWPIRFFNNQELSRISVPNPSEIVNKEVGCPSVAEASCLLAAGDQAKLCQEKHVFKAQDNEKGGVTIAISKAKKPFSVSKGELHLIGIGPGDISFLTGDAKRALSRTPLWIGYKKYLDFIEVLRREDQIRIDSELTFEKDRCAQAIDLASQGVLISLVSSGDSGIYGMASLALELLLERPQELRPYFSIHPGISSMQMAASIIGAPLANDFCSISLSNLLTPWEKIKERITGAAIGDFVIAFYNPKSKERNWQIKAAIEILLTYRSEDTPVIFARQLTRDGEEVKCYSLTTIPFEEVDMLTTLIVGNSNSLVKDDWFLNPRGYLKSFD